MLERVALVRAHVQPHERNGYNFERLGYGQPELRAALTGG